MTEKLVLIQGNCDSVRVSGVVRVIGVRVSGVLLSRTPLTRTLKGNENLFELAGFRVIGVD